MKNLRILTAFMEPRFRNLIPRFEQKDTASRRLYKAVRQGQMKHQLDATMCRFYFCRVNLHVSGGKRPSSGVFKTSTAATGTCVIVAGKSSHLLIRAHALETCRVTLQK